MLAWRRWKRNRAIAEARSRLERLSLRERFELIDALGIYHGESSVSGHASDPPETERIRRWLPDLVRRLGVASVLDAPCGDCAWIAQTDFLDAASYIGIDVVPAIVERNVRRFGERPTFFCRDVTADPLPDADLILCRDLLIHLSDADAMAALDRFAETSARWLVTTSFRARPRNRDVDSGEFRPVNLEAPPFSFPPPTEVCVEGSTLAGGRFADRALCVWAMDEVRARLGGRANALRG